MFGATRLAKNTVQISLIRDIVLELILVQVFQLQTLIGVNKNVVIFGVDNSPSVDIDNKEKKYLSPQQRSNTRVRRYYDNSRSRIFY